MLKIKLLLAIRKLDTALPIILDANFLPLKLLKAWHEIYKYIYIYKHPTVFIIIIINYI